jgi:hypothetical protein
VNPKSFYRQVLFAVRLLPLELNYFTKYLSFAMRFRQACLTAVALANVVPRKGSGSSIESVVVRWYS